MRPLLRIEPGGGCMCFMGQALVLFAARDFSLVHIFGTKVPRTDEFAALQLAILLPEQ